MIRASVANVFTSYFDGVETRRVVEWFDLGGTLQLADTSSAADVLTMSGGVQGLSELAAHAGAKPTDPPPLVAAALDFVLEGLYALKKISRNDERGYHGAEPARRPTRTAEPTLDEGMPMPGTGKKKYYN